MYINICIYIYIYVYIYICIYIYIYVYIYICIYISISVYQNTDVLLSIYVVCCMHTWEYGYSVCIYLYFLDHACFPWQPDVFLWASCNLYNILCAVHRTQCVAWEGGNTKVHVFLGRQPFLSKRGWVSVQYAAHSIGGWEHSSACFLGSQPLCLSGLQPVQSVYTTQHIA